MTWIQTVVVFTTIMSDDGDDDDDGDVTDDDVWPSSPPFCSHALEAFLALTTTELPIASPPFVDVNRAYSARWFFPSSLLLALRSCVCSSTLYWLRDSVCRMSLNGNFIFFCVERPWTVMYELSSAIYVILIICCTWWRTLFALLFAGAPFDVVCINIIPFFVLGSFYPKMLECKTDKLGRIIECLTTVVLNLWKSEAETYLLSILD